MVLLVLLLVPQQEVASKKTEAAVLGMGVDMGAW